ncbi:reticulon-like protein B22 isoform X1 [Solanum lycopersicum]|uniref:reticulon-like protein B22 isoform X1 n=1 Tax=Solanum lycopersicum TaxID=4081 RepID=UPI0037496DA5
MEELNANEEIRRTINPRRKKDLRGPVPFIIIICGTLVYYHCVYRNASIVSLVSDVFTVILCSLAILGLLYRQMNISVPVDPLEWQISQNTANRVLACIANTIGAAESVLRVSATGHDKRLFVKVVVTLYVLSVLGRIASGVTVAYAEPDRHVKLYKFAPNPASISHPVDQYHSQLSDKKIMEGK